MLEEAVIDYGVQEEPPTSIFQEQKQYFGPEFDYQAIQKGQFEDDVDTDEMMPDPITIKSRRGTKPPVTNAMKSLMSVCVAILLSKYCCWNTSTPLRHLTSFLSTTSRVQ